MGVFARGSVHHSGPCIFLSMICYLSVCVLFGESICAGHYACSVLCVSTPVWLPVVLGFGASVRAKEVYCVLS
jgi:hypothetical protein